MELVSVALGFLCFTLGVIVGHLLTKQSNVKTEEVPKTSFISKVTTTRPDNIAARKHASAAYVRDIEASISKGVPDYEQNQDFS